ncbi:UBX domain-containing protein, putative [Ixodes scapularis]|uniref:UBX domain-containing protein 4 n=1 Tax=Ixodes scapularis TaxID=6945 RepID=B7Q6R2_IXOSC|nr:UBX domain-containing protein, putative [Ixodes scapularis]|eukprot:XP_002403277.1 UBX domain-containing protein, putative [Ixodes scapularis]
MDALSFFLSEAPDPVVVVPSSFFIGCNGIPLEVIAGSVGPQELLERIENVVQYHTRAGGTCCRVKAKRLLEERRLQKLKEEEEATKRSELERRRVARELQLARQAKEDGERREWAQKRAREKEEERRHREAIQAQIAQDRADRAERYQHERAQEEQQRRGREAALLQEQQQRLSQEAAARSVVARIQFRLPDGSSATHTFDATATLQDLRNFVLETIRPGFSSFSLSTTFPRKEFTHGQYSQSLQQLELTPSAVLLVVPNQAVVPSALSDSGVSALKFLGSLLTPLMFLWSLLTGLFFGSPAPTEPQGVAPDPPQEQG